MPPQLQNVLVFAVWGSLAATVILGAFSAVQAAVDPARRVRFLLFALVMGYLGGLDLLLSVLHLDPLTYEWLRIWWCSAYAGSVLVLLGFPRRVAVATSLGLLLLGFSVFHWVNPALATTATFPWAFVATSLAFGRRYTQHRGYASVVLSAFSAAMAVMCAFYFAALSTQKPAVIIFGYAHYAELSILAVLMGWVHLPRELRGRAPVKMHPGLAAGLVASVVASELVIMTGLLRSSDQPSLPVILGATIQAASVLAIYLHHRHQLVIHADNIGQLLEEAKKELARQNDILALRLSEQAKDLDGKNRDLQSKNEVIDRQRRLELAAQTAGQVAHDIQNLISPLFTGVDALEEVRTLNDIRGLTKGFRNQLGQLLDLNTNLLALARRGRVELQPVNVGQLASDVVARFPGQHVTLDPRGEAWVTGSYAQLSRAASNLIVNSIESDLDRQVPVVVRSGLIDIAQNRRCHLGFLGPGHYAFLEVEDRGPGIPDTHLEKIFEPFYSSKSGRHRSGSGLGLTIVSAVVDDHQGVVDLKSSPDGTRFTLYFPSIDPPRSLMEVGALSSPATVLVVDDDSSVLKEYGEILEKAGYTVIHSESGSRAIGILQLQEVDLVLLDLNMPRMTGLETFLGAMHVRPGVRAVVHSSHVTEEQGMKLKSLGVSSVLLKPAGRLEVLRALRQAYDEKIASQNRKTGR